MTDLVFEDPPKKSRRSEHWDYLLALKEHPATETFTGWARYRGDDPMTEKLATGLATSLRHAASKLGEGWEVTALRLPATENYGVWVRYVPQVGDEPTPATGDLSYASLADPAARHEAIDRVLVKRTPPKPAPLPDEPEFHDNNGERDSDPGAWLDEHA
jgi:hypothetical protein